MHLYLGYKNYSSWSLRPWLALKMADISFEETLIAFAHTDDLQKLAERYSIPAKVPVLEHEGRLIWDSLAILEYLAETFPEKNLWPEDKTLRAMARCASAEMHSGFVALRSEFPMNCRAHTKRQASALVQADLQRLSQIWQSFADCEKPNGEFLCGAFSLVDAMFAPVMWRIRGYGLHISADFDRWSDALFQLPAMQEWWQEAKQEEWRLPETDELA